MTYTTHRETAKILGLLAERLVKLASRQVTRQDLDEIIVTLRQGEKALIEAMEDTK